jgi:hypothetical protein
VLMYSEIRSLDLLFVFRRVRSASIEHSEHISMSISSGSSAKRRRSATRDDEAFRQRVSENIVSGKDSVLRTSSRGNRIESEQVTSWKVAAQQSRNRSGRLLETWMLLL